MGFGDKMLTATVDKGFLGDSCDTHHRTLEMCRARQTGCQTNCLATQVGENFNFSLPQINHNGQSGTQ